MCSGAGLMAALRVQHPAATLLKEAVHGQQEDTGTGSTLLLSAVGPLLDCAMRLLRDGCALPTIMGALRRMQEAGRVLFAAAAVDLHQLSGAAQDDKAAWLGSRLAGFEGLANEPAGRGVLPGGSDSSRHPLNWQERLGMGLAHGAEQAMQLAMAAVALLEDRRACLRAASLSRSQRARARQGHRRVTAPINVLLAPGLGQEASVVVAGWWWVLRAGHCSYGENFGRREPGTPASIRSRPPDLAVVAAAATAEEMMAAGGVLWRGSQGYMGCGWWLPRRAPWIDRFAPVRQHGVGGDARQAWW